MSKTVKVRVSGFDVNAFPSYESAVDTIRDRILERRKTLCFAVNPEKLHRAGRDPALQQVLGRADILLCDGIGVSLAGWLLQGRRIPRCTGIQLFFHLVKAAERECWKVFLLGASPESNEGACRRLRSMHPGLSIAGSHSGFFRDSAHVIGEINSSEADIVFVAMGSPRQEFWIAEHADDLRPALCMGVGGTFDVLSGTARWAPPVFRKTGTEWLFRLVSDPARARRQLALPRFAFAVIGEAVRRSAAR